MVGWCTTLASNNWTSNVPPPHVQLEHIKIDVEIKKEEEGRRRKKKRKKKKQENLGQCFCLHFNVFYDKQIS